MHDAREKSCRRLTEYATGHDVMDRRRARIRRSGSRAERAAIGVCVATSAASPNEANAVFEASGLQRQEQKVKSQLAPMAAKSCEIGVNYGLVKIMELNVTIELWQKGRYYVAKCPELDFISQGRTTAEAKNNLLEVIDIQFEEMAEIGTLEDSLTEL
jgi:predicted RNase H-like HicB family nuclease